MKYLLTDLRKFDEMYNAFGGKENFNRYLNNHIDFTTPNKYIFELNGKFVAFKKSINDKVYNMRDKNGDIYENTLPITIIDRIMYCNTIEDFERIFNELCDKYVYVYDDLADFNIDTTNLVNSKEALVLYRKVARAVLAEVGQLGEEV